MSPESSGPRIGVITFPGTLDDGDAARAARYAGAEAVPLWHGSESQFERFVGERDYGADGI